MMKLQSKWKITPEVVTPWPLPSIFLTEGAWEAPGITTLLWEVIQVVTKLRRFIKHMHDIWSQTLV